MSLQTLEKVKDKLNERYRATGRWESVAAEFGVSLGTAVRVAHGYNPRTPAVRKALGLPPLVSVPVCPLHGVVHPGHCPKQRPNPKSLADWPVKALAQAIRNRR